jgi:heat shock protein HslJ
MGALCMVAAMAASLEGTHWRATAIGERPVVTGANREVYLLFESGGRVSGSDGCNRIVGSYQVTGDAITLRQLAGTQMACPDSEDTERAFRAALADARRYRIGDDRLELYDAAGAMRARFQAHAGGAASRTRSGELGGTSWQLVAFQGSDDTTLTPDNRAKYAVAFAADGSLTVRIDCNRGRGIWKSSGASQLTLGPLALTRAMCPPGSLHDRIVKDWSFVRSYVIRNGHLFLSLMADGGIYEFEPIGGTRR